MSSSSTTDKIKNKLQLIDLLLARRGFTGAFQMNSCSHSGFSLQIFHLRHLNFSLTPTDAANRLDSLGSSGIRRTRRGNARSPSSPLLPQPPLLLVPPVSGLLKCGCVQLCLQRLLTTQGSFDICSTPLING